MHALQVPAGRADPCTAVHDQRSRHHHPRGRLPHSWHLSSPAGCCHAEVPCCSCSQRQASSTCQNGMTPARCGRTTTPRSPTVRPPHLSRQMHAAMLATCCQPAATGYCFVGSFSALLPPVALADTSLWSSRPAHRGVCPLRLCGVQAVDGLCEPGQPGGWLLLWHHRGPQGPEQRLPWCAVHLPASSWQYCCLGDVTCAQMKPTSAAAEALQVTNSPGRCCQSWQRCCASCAGPAEPDAVQVARSTLWASPGAPRHR